MGRLGRFLHEIDPPWFLRARRASEGSSQGRERPGAASVAPDPDSISSGGLDPVPMPSRRESAPVDGPPGALSQLIQELAQAPDEALLQAWAAEPKPGDRIGRFVIRREIGRGGFGAVYEALDEDLGRLVAVKALRPLRIGKGLPTEWIEREARSVARLDHPCIVTLHDVGRFEQGPYLVMELLQGSTLAQRLASGPLPREEALHVARQVARGLAHAHQRGLLHRDLKPANVFLCQDGRVKLLDFGLAHLLGTSGALGCGTPGYMAPEQARGEGIGASADVYAAAVTLQESLTGRRPSGADPPPEAPHAVARVIARGRAAAPGDRPRDGAEWLALLKEAGGGAARRRRRIVARVAAVAMVAATAGAGAWAWRYGWQAGSPLAGATSSRVVERPTVVVADFVNETGEKELDSLSELLIATLEPSRGLQVLTRSRMLDVLRQMGKEPADRIDEPLARDIGRASGTPALLLATVRRVGTSYVVELRAVDPVRDEYLFTLQERAPGKEAIPDLVDRLGEGTRRQLAPKGGAQVAAGPGIARLATSDVKAWDLFFRARQAIDHMRFRDAYDLLHQALQVDPEFALAHYQLAMLFQWEVPDPSATRAEKVEAGRRASAAALRRADRLPEKERLLLRSFEAFRVGPQDDAVQMRRQVADAYPLDKEAQLLAGHVLVETLDAADAVPYLRRALQLDPSYPMAKRFLARAITEAGLAREYADWIRREAPGVQDAETRRHFASAFLAAGLEEEALGFVRMAEANVPDPALRWPLASHHLFHGRLEEAQGVVAGPLGWRFLMATGRIAEATVLIGEERPPASAMARLQLAGLSGSDEDLQEADTAIEPSGNMPYLWSIMAAYAVPVLIHAGDLPAATRMAGAARGAQVRGLHGSAEDLLLGAVVAWGRGDRAAADKGFRALAANPNVAWHYLGHLMRGDLALDGGDCRGAIAELEEARALPWTPHVHSLWQWSFPGMLRSLARCHEASGNQRLAAERTDELLRRWSRADQDLPLLWEARAAQARMALLGR